MRVFNANLWKTCMNRGFYAACAERQAESGVRGMEFRFGTRGWRWRRNLALMNGAIASTEVQVVDCDAVDVIMSADLPLSIDDSVL